MRTFLEHQIRKMVQEASSDAYGLGLPEDWSVEHPILEDHGDYATNLPFILAKILKQSPLEIAKRIAESPVWTKSDLVGKVEALAPGFVNIFLSQKTLMIELKRISAEGREYGKKKATNPLKVSFEHTQPNTNKPLHLGHIRNAVLGMAMTRLYQTQGHKALSVNINNDRGIHVIKCLWGYLRFAKKEKASLWDWKAELQEWRGFPENWHAPADLTPKQWREIASEAGLPTVALSGFRTGQGVKSDHFVGQFYILGNAWDEKDATVKKEMLEMLSSWEEEEENMRVFWQKLNSWFYQGAWETLKTLGVFYDKEWYESQIYKKGKAIVEEGIKKGVFQQFPDGHVEAVLAPFGLPNCVLLRSNRTALYITQDLELIRERMIEDKVDLNVYLTGNEQALRFRQLFKMAEMLGFGRSEQFHHFAYGMVRLASGKMSSRLGTVVLADDLIYRMKDLAWRKMEEGEIRVSVDEKEKTALQVALAAIKYGFLRYNPLAGIRFDAERSISLEGESGPYLQYTHARCCSILGKAGKAARVRKTVLGEKAEVDILRWIYRYGEVVEIAAQTYSPNLLCSFLYTLAQRFNFFYNTLPVLRAAGQAHASRLLLVTAVRQVLANGLSVLGITPLEKM